MSARAPRLVIGGTGSGCGKTTITCALLQAFVEQGLDTAAFKCGPDYIDPMFHSRIIGHALAQSGRVFVWAGTGACAAAA